VPVPVIEAKSTVVTLPKATEDVKVTSMVPASLRVKRERAGGGEKGSVGRMAQKQQQQQQREGGGGKAFGLIPRAAGGSVVEKKKEEKTETKKKEGGEDKDASYEEFMSSMKELGAV